MKALRNPYVLVVLIALASVLGYYRFRAPKVVAAAAPEPKPARQKIAGPDASMDLDKLGWTSSPTRDPFCAVAVQVAPTITQQEAAPVVEVLDLKAIWLHEGAGWAVINGKVLGEGDLILEFRVEKILADGVLVQGPGGRREVRFKPASAKPRPAPLVAGSPAGKGPLKPTPGKQITRIPGVPLNLTPDPPLTMQDVTNAVGQVFGPAGTAVTGLLKSPEKGSP